MTLADLIQMGNGSQRPVGYGGSRGYATAGYTPRQPLGADYMQQLFGLGQGGMVHPVGQGGSLRPQTGAEALQNLFGIGNGGHPQMQAPMFQPAPAIPQYFTGDWSGMRRNIGMPVGGGMGGQYGGLPQRNLFGGGTDGGATLGSLLSMLGGGYRG